MRTNESKNDLDATELDSFLHLFMDYARDLSPDQDDRFSGVLGCLSECVIPLP